MQFRPSGEFLGSPVLYRDHQKGPGGPPGGATYPGGPRGLKWEGNQPLVGWCAPPLGPPPTPRVGNPRVGGRTTCLGGHSTPLAAAPLGDSHLQGRRPPGGLYKGGGREGSRTPESWRLPPLLHLFLLPRLLGEALPEYCFSTTTTPSCCCCSFLPQPLLPPCWIKKEETSSAPYVC